MNGFVAQPLSNNPKPAKNILKGYVPIYSMEKEGLAAGRAALTEIKMQKNGLNKFYIFPFSFKKIIL